MQECLEGGDEIARFFFKTDFFPLLEHYKDPILIKHSAPHKNFEKTSQKKVRRIYFVQPKKGCRKNVTKWGGGGGVIFVTFRQTELSSPPPKHVSEVTMKGIRTSKQSPGY